MRNFYFVAFLVLCTFNLRAAENDGFDKESFSKSATDNHAFEENRGQIKGEEAHNVLFFHKKAGMSMFLMPTGIAYQFHQYTKLGQESDKPGDFSGGNPLDGLERPTYEVATYRMDMDLVGANPNAKVTSYGKSQDYVNYYTIDEMRVHSYEKVVYENIYPNIDWVIYKNEIGIKYDFIVKPNGDPNQIQFKAKWVEKMSIDVSGNLILENRLGKVQENKPISFQNEKQVETSFVLKENLITFKLGAYNKNETIIIDPDLVWGSYYGGGSSDAVFDIATDSQGNVYFCGSTLSINGIAQGGFLNNSPVSGGFGAAFLVKFNAVGQRIWGTSNKLIGL